MGVKIVVADDDRATVASLERALILQGFWVYAAKDGAEALELVRKEEPDLVVSDMLMPNLHGLELCKNIKESPGSAHVKVILITSVYKGTQGRKEAMESGADDFMEKPVEMEDLLERIYKLLDIKAEEFSKEYIKSKSDDGE